MLSTHLEIENKKNMSFSFVRLTALAVLFSIAIFALFPAACGAGDMSDAEVDELFKCHPDSEWKALALRWSSAKARMTSPAENLSIPLEHHPSGIVKARLTAKKIQIFSDGSVFANGVTVDLYDTKGVKQGYLKAGDCIFERGKSHGYCKGRVEVKQGSDVLSGTGMYFSFSDEYIKILANCKIRTKRFQVNLGRLL